MFTNSLLSSKAWHRIAGSAAALALLGGLGAASIGCGGIGPGDYILYRVAAHDGVQGASCYPNGDIPPNQKSDSSSIFKAGTLAIFVSADDKYYVEFDGTVLEGSYDSDTYSFSGKTVDVEYADPNGTGDKTTTTDTQTVTINVDGDAIGGTMLDKKSTKCAGAGCGPSYSCTTTIDFDGSRVDDVELKHDL